MLLAVLRVLRRMALVKVLKFLLEAGKLFKPKFKAILVVCQMAQMLACSGQTKNDCVHLA